jgi:hypothetical protein
MCRRNFLTQQLLARDLFSKALKRFEDFRLAIIFMFLDVTQLTRMVQLCIKPLLVALSRKNIGKEFRISLSFNESNLI